MGYEKVEGIIISEFNFKESSKILNVLTKEYGQISVVSRGCRSLKNKLRSVSNKLTHAIFDIKYKEGKISTLIDAEVINTYNNTRQSIEKITYTSIILDLANQVLKQTNNKEIFDIVLNSLNLIEEDLDSEAVLIIVSLKLLEFLGVKPNIETIDKEHYKFSQRAEKLIQMFFYVDLSKVTKLNISSPVKRELEQFIEQYYQDYTGIYLKSSEFLKYIKTLT